jgi:putative membrane protein insertion efficiency factor
MKISLFLINFYQKYLTIISPGKCRYYPSCSEYAKWQFSKQNFFRAFFSSLIRILRCNQLFTGGIDYPIVYIKDLKFKYGKPDLKIEYWLVPYKKDRYYLIKVLKDI